VYKNCFLSLKTKQMSERKDDAFAGYVETGKAATLLDSLKDVVLKRLGTGVKFKMVVESYRPVKVENKVVAIKGLHRHVYSITDNIGIILGYYNSQKGIDELLHFVEGFTREGQAILENRRYTIPERCKLLTALKDKIDSFNTTILARGCLVRIDVKESKDCRTFQPVGEDGDASKKPQYRIASSLDIKTLESIALPPGSPIVTTSPERGLKQPLYKSWSDAVSGYPVGRSERSAEETENLLQEFYSNTTSVLGDRGPPTPEEVEPRIPRPRPRSKTPSRAQTPGKAKTPSRAQTPGKSKTPKSSGRMEISDEMIEREKEKRKQERDQRRLKREQISLFTPQPAQPIFVPASFGQPGPVFSTIPSVPYSPGFGFPVVDHEQWPRIDEGSKFSSSPAFLPNPY
jgi:hypothetical protein